MAVATTHTPSSSNSNSSYDVFLSFRGEDTRYTFTDHLYQALKQHGIHTFRDDQGLNRGAEIAPELLNVIEGSIFSIVVFSENYANSKWCLEEVAKIMECQKKGSQTVIPVFYHVDPSEQVRKQGGSYGKAFALHEKGADEEKRKNIQKWRSALSEASNLAGYHVVKDEYESKHIKKITNLILKSLNSKLMSIEEFIVGMDLHKHKLKSLLRIHCMVGIYGIGGIGKTTIAKIIYNDVLFEFDGGSFLENVKEKFEKGHQLQLLQQLLCDIMKSDVMLRTINDGMNMIKGRLRSKKVLIVIDDVDDLNQLELLVGSLEWFGIGSRIIITTRNRQLLSKYRKNASSYEIKGLNYKEAFQLFCWHAFEQNDLQKNYENLSKRIVDYAQGLPLALKVLGGFLRCKGTMDAWENALNKLKKNLDKDINKVLRISFEGLDEYEKEVFLDIAYFFKGEDQDSVSEILDDCGLYGKMGINALFSKCLITISYNTIGMHDLIQQMGWAIVRDKSFNNPYKESRLWDADDIYHVFSEKKGIKNIEVLLYDLSRVKGIKVNTKVFAKMKKLRLLKVYRSKSGSSLILPKDFEFPSQELRCLYWEAYPLKTLPSNFQGENLIELSMRHSNIKRLWSGDKILGKLKVIDLSWSSELIEISNLSTVPNLETLDLVGCMSLRKIDPSIGVLKKLAFLDLGFCKQLGSLPSSFKYLTSLRSLELSRCSNFEKFPEIFDNMKRLRWLKLKHSGIKELPRSIVGLESLEKLDLRRCRNLEKFPEIQGNMKSLRHLDLRNTAIKELPRGIECLKSLRTLVSDCIKLEIRRYMGNLWRLDSDGSAIKELPSFICHLTRLGRLELLNLRNLRSLPSSIWRMKSLESIEIVNCWSLESLPEMECLHGFSSIETATKELSSSTENLRGLRSLELRHCESFMTLPDSINNLTCLKTLIVSDCSNLQKLPDNLRSLQRCLEELDVSGCKVGEGSIPNDLWSLYSLRSLDISRNDIKSIPAGILQLTNLRRLYMNDCKLLEEITELPSSLRILNARGCACLETTSSKFWSSQIKCLKSLVEEVECDSNRKYDFFDYCREKEKEIEIEIVLPGNNGMPEWVRHRKRGGGEVTIDLPPNWYNDNNFLGFALFFHFNHDPCQFYSATYQLMISGGDQFEEVYSYRSYKVELLYGQLVVICVPQIVISENHRSNKWRKLKARLSFHSALMESDEERLIPEIYKSTACGIHLIYAEVHQREYENRRRNGNEAEIQREPLPQHPKRSRLF